MPGRKGRPVDKSKLSNLRSARSLSRGELADLALVPYECVEKAELRGRRTNDEVVTSLAAALGVNENAIR